MAESSTSARTSPGRRLLPSDKIAPGALAKLGSLHPETIEEIEKAITAHDVVVIGMAQNPHVKAARKALDEAQIAHHYLEYGSYFSEWKKRLSIKLWSGWPTFPQVFVKGVLIGGADLTRAAIADKTIG